MRLFLFLLAFGLSASSSAQVPTPIHWTSSIRKVDPTTYEIHLKAVIDKGWHTYSQTTPDGGPLPSVVKVSRSPLYKLSGTVQEIGKLEEHLDKTFGVNVKQYSDSLDFVQTIVLKKPVSTTIPCTVTYMVCNSQQCLPPTDQTFSVNIP